MNLSQRSYKKELLDGDNIPFEDIKRNMQELNFINTWLGGHAISISAFIKLVGKRKAVSVCEIGCGGGDNLLAIARHCNRKKINISITGIDLKQECIDFAASRTYSTTSIEWIADDYRNVHLSSKPDIVFSSLFCHHFTNDELVSQLQWMKNSCGIGFFINDLHRHPLAYYSIKLLTQLFSSSTLVKNDAPLSVARGFVKDELQMLCNKSGLHNAQVQWRWAYRYLILFRH